MISSVVLYSMIKLGLTYIAGMQARSRFYSDPFAVHGRIEVDAKSSVEKRGVQPFPTTPSSQNRRAHAGRPIGQSGGPPLCAVTVTYQESEGRPTGFAD